MSAITFTPGTVLVLAIIAVLVFFAVRYLVRSGSCSCAPKARDAKGSQAGCTRSSCAGCAGCQSVDQIIVRMNEQARLNG